MARASKQSVGNGMGGLGKARLEALTDGVFAIALTLLVLDIHVPDIPAHDAARLLPGRLLALLPKMLGFAVSFIILGIYWVAHHILFASVRRTDRVLLWLNNLFLLCVAFIPFPTGLVGSYSSVRLAVDLYGASLITTSMVLYAIIRYATDNDRLVDPAMDRRLRTAAKRRTLLGPCVYTAAILFSFWDTRITMALYLLVPLVLILPSPADRFWGGGG